MAVVPAPPGDSCDSLYDSLVTAYLVTRRGEGGDREALELSEMSQLGLSTELPRPLPRPLGWQWPVSVSPGGEH